MLPVLVIPRRFEDDRGWFCESYNADRLAEAGIGDRFVQDNHSHSRSRGTVRGLHYQIAPAAQAKLVRCTAGAIWDVAVDIRAGSPTRGRWVAAELTAAGGEQLYVPIGFAHGFVTLTEATEVQYKASAFYAPALEGSIRWNDPDLAIDWPVPAGQCTLSDRDAAAPPLADTTIAFAYDGTPLGKLAECRL